MTISDLLIKLGTKAGLPMSDPRFANLLSVSTEFPAEDAQKILGSLFTIEDAKQNFDLKNWFTKAALDGADSELNKIMEDHGLEIADREELKAIKSTYERIGKTAKKIADLEKRKVGATTGEKKELQEQINLLTTKMVETQKTHETEIKVLKEAHNAEMTENSSRQILSAIKTIYDELPATAKLAAMEAVIKEKLVAKDIVLVRVGNTIVPKQAKDPSLDWYDPKTNEKPTYEQLVSGILAESKILAVNAPPPPANNGNGLGNYLPPTVNGNGNPNVNQELIREMQKDQLAVDQMFKQ